MRHEPSVTLAMVTRWRADRVEQNNADEGYADLVTGRCDEDTTEAEGSPGRGSLRNGLNLPDRNTGYTHFHLRLRN